MTRTILVAAMLAAAAQAGCVDEAPGGATAFERDFGDAVVRVHTGADGDLVAEVYAGDPEPVAVLTWQTAAGAGEIVAGGQSWGVGFEASEIDGASPIDGAAAAAELAHTLWGALSPDAATPDAGGFCVGGHPIGFECCIFGQPFFECHPVV